MDYSPEALKIVPALYDSNKSNNMQPLRDLLSGKICPEFSIEIKEKEILNEIILCYGVIDNTEDILSYLIFDYKIKESTLDNLIPYPSYNPNNSRHIKIKEMFKTRVIEERHSELNQELSLKPKITNKKPKV
jgi:hypothetical protein